MANLNGYNANDHEPRGDFTPIPAGRYPAIIVASEQKKTKNQGGSYLELTFQVIDGEFKGRQQWARLNLQNKNPTAVKIAMQELSSICRAVGVMQPKDSIELHNLPLTITVKCVKREDTGDITNEIAGYAKKDGSPVGTSTGPAPGNQPGQPAGNSTPPWARAA